MQNRLDLIIGPVCSGKSAELIRRVERFRIADYKVLVIKPEIDTRAVSVKSRTGTEVSCVSLNDLTEVLSYANLYDVIAIDEAQFFKDLYSVVKFLLKDMKKRVLVSGLDADFNGQIFGEVSQLVSLASSVDRLTAICMVCKNDDAIFSQKLKKGGDQIEIGDLEIYQPRCINCFIPGGLEKI